jgi:tetrahydromethanopterin S-methyltransferase subunit E
MHDDEAMDRLLRDAMAGDAPQLSPAFDGRVMRRVRPRRLTPMGRVVIAVYVVVAAAAAAWLMRDLRLESIVAALAIGMPVAAATSAYVRRLAAGH